MVSAPTGSGKTGILELAMVKLFADAHVKHGMFAPSPGAVKALYLAPNRALVQVTCSACCGTDSSDSAECRMLA